MNKIDLIPLLQAFDFEGDVEDEMVENEVNTHYQADILSFDWDDDESYPATKKWLVEFYGEEIRNFDQFAIMPT